MAGVKPAKCRILLVDNHPMLRRGLADLIGEDSNLTVCGEARDIPEALDLIAEVKPNLVIVDLPLGEREGMQLIKEVRIQYPEVLLLVLSMHDEDVYAERTLRAGARGYVMKAEAAGTVMDAIHQVLSGRIYISAKVNDQLLHRVETPRGRTRNSASPVDTLSDRELEIFRLLGEGMRVREIAAQLHLSVSTIETHRVNIKGKLGIKGSAELLRYAIKFARNQP